MINKYAGKYLIKGKLAHADNALLHSIPFTAYCLITFH